MSTFKNIALWGIGGQNIGSSILTALLADNSYNLTIIARESSTSTYAPSLPLIRVSDDLSHSSLVSALRNQDVLISAVGFAGLSSQLNLARAAIEAGVKRFIPSEYGFDNADPKNAALSPIFRPKHELEKQLVELVKQNPGFTWTALATGIWLDWALDVKFIDIDPEAHQVVYWDEGTQAPSMTTLEYTAQAVIQVLKHPAQFRNQRVFMEAFAASQRDVVEELERVQGVEYESQRIDGREKVREVMGVLEKGFELQAALATVRAELFVGEYKADFVRSGKEPILERVVDMPKITLRDVVREYVARH
ncbi:NAD(P)-binding protein [Mollisia scopiformis]|uniref:NAD(P)-binding protein n=1 Tax=Mollisia scopiformis TaxID=149040 RepID=A0A194WYI9_MOLSC|nr:NAD(P)-binding protein [Mollisia scopiformis]KUJ13010.1 NAD(P)-binding protein [Mollisia scopiformis]